MPKNKKKNRLPVATPIYQAVATYAPQKKKKKKKNNTANRAASVVSGIGQILASALNANPQTKIGGLLANTAMSAFSRIIGRGDYSMSNPVKMNSLINGKIPASASFGGSTETIRVRDRECIGYVYAQGDNDFTPLVHICQPGLPTSFPKLAAIAVSWVNYKFHGLVYEFVSSVSSYSSVPNMGQIVMTFDPNQGGDFPSSNLALANMNHSVAEKPSTNLVYGVECDPKELPYNEYFIRSGDTPAQAGAVEDFGRLYLSTADLPPSVYTAGMRIGALYATYDVEFRTSRLVSVPTGYFSRTARDYTSGNTSIFGTSDVRLIRSGVFANTFIGSSDTTQPTWRNSIVLANVPIGTVFTMAMEYSDATLVNTTNPAFTLAGVVDSSIFWNGTTYVSTLQTNLQSGITTVVRAFQVIGNPLISTREHPMIVVSLTGTNTAALDVCTILLNSVGNGATPATPIA